MSASIVIICIVAGFLAGLMTGVLIAYHIFAALGRVEAAISEAAQRAWPF